MTFKQRWTNPWYLVGIGLVAVVMAVVLVVWEHVTGEDLGFWAIFGLDALAFTSFNVTWHFFGASEKTRERRNH